MKFFDRLSNLLKNLWLIPIGRHISVSPFFIVLGFASVMWDYADVFFVSYLSAFLHECAHIVTARALKVGIRRIEVLPFGICGKLGAGFIKNPYKEIIIATAGPLLSGMLSLFLCQLSESRMLLKYQSIIEYGININIALMIINLVPALPLDGGRILKGLISINCGAVRAYNIMIKISRVMIIAILGAAVLLLLINDFNLSLILIGAFLLGNLTLEQKNISIISLREILYHKDSLERSGFCPVVRLAAHSSVSANLFLRRLGCYKYHIIDVVDDDGVIIKTITESQLISALINRSIRLTMGEI